METLKLVNNTSIVQFLVRVVWASFSDKIVYFGKGYTTSRFV